MGENKVKTVKKKLVGKKKKKRANIYARARLCEQAINQRASVRLRESRPLHGLCAHFSVGGGGREKNYLKSVWDYFNYFKLLWDDFCRSDPFNTALHMRLNVTLIPSNKYPRPECRPK